MLPCLSAAFHERRCDLIHSIQIDIIVASTRSVRRVIIMTQPTRKIFINYRQADNRDFVNRIRDWLMQHYGRDNVFMDFDNLPAGVRFERDIKDRIAESDALLAIIGPDWLKLLNERAADGDIDYVKVELETALQQPDLVIIPVCIKDATMPRARELPESLRELCELNAARLNDGRGFYDEIADLMRDIEALMPGESDITEPAIDEIFEPLLATAKEYVERAIDRLLSGDIDAAIADCNAALWLKPKWIGAYLARGMAYHTKSDLDKAIDDFDEVLSQNYNHAIVYALRGRVYSDQNMYIQANADYRHAIELGHSSRDEIENWIRDNEAKMRGDT